MLVFNYLERKKMLNKLKEIYYKYPIILYWVAMIFFIIAVLCSCTTSKYVQNDVRVVDSTVIVYDTVKYHLPIEYVQSFDLDSSFLETSLAISTVRLDTIGDKVLINHTLRNKDKDIDIEVKKEIHYKYITKTKYRTIKQKNVFNDSLVAIPLMLILIYLVVYMLKGVFK